MFKRRNKTIGLNLPTDIHSHILPGVDDGARDTEEALNILRGMAERGIRSVWLTPHIKEDRYPNTASSINKAFGEFSETVRQEGIDIKMSIAAEYFIGPKFMDLIASGERLLAMNDKYLLIETSMHQEPLFLYDALFAIKQRGLTPIMAHPERYTYCHNAPAIYTKLKKSGCLFQLNIFSLTEYYGKDVRTHALQLIKTNQYDFAGTDIHNVRHLESLADKNICKTLQSIELKNNLLS